MNENSPVPLSAKLCSWQDNTVEGDFDPKPLFFSLWPILNVFQKVVMHLCFVSELKLAVVRKAQLFSASERETMKSVMVFNS